jgi:hypothetical protein
VLQGLACRLISEGMVVLRKYTMLMQAELARLELASFGIDSTILDQILGSIAPHLTMHSGVRLVVAEEDEQEAETILVAMKKRNAK